MISIRSTDRKTGLSSVHDLKMSEGGKVDISIEGYGQHPDVVGNGSAVTVEVDGDGEARVLVYGDIERPEPTDFISLEKARKDEARVGYKQRTSV